MVDFGHMVLTKIKCIPIVIHLSKKYCTPLGIHYITACDRSMVELAEFFPPSVHI